MAASDRGAFLSSLGEILEDSQLWGLIPFTHPIFLLRRQCDSLYESLFQEQNVFLSALYGHGIDEMLHLVGQSLPSGLLILL